MKKIIVMISIMLLICGCTGRNDKKEVKGEITSVNCEEALDIQADEGLLVDVREKEEFEESHLEGAVNISEKVIEEKIDQYATDKDTPIILYCKSGKRSASAAKKLLEAGYTNIYDLGSINNCS